MKTRIAIASHSGSINMSLELDIPRYSAAIVVATNKIKVKVLRKNLINLLPERDFCFLLVNWAFRVSQGEIRIGIRIINPIM